MPSFLWRERCRYFSTEVSFSSRRQARTSIERIDSCLTGGCSRRVPHLSLTIPWVAHPFALFAKGWVRFYPRYTSDCRSISHPRTRQVSALTTLGGWLHEPETRLKVLVTGLGSQNRFVPWSILP